MCQRRSSEHVCRSGCRSVEARVIRTASRRDRRVRRSAWSCCRVMVGVLVAMVGRNLGRRRERKVKMGRRIERIWPRDWVGRESWRIRALA
jgi:hypothetical protein